MGGGGGMDIRHRALEITFDMGRTTLMKQKRRSKKKKKSKRKSVKIYQNGRRDLEKEGIG